MQLKKFFKTLLKSFRWLLIQPFLLLIYFYRNCISPFTPNACRFTPTCSAYAVEALKTRGLVVGLALTLWRILRCNPWGGSGYDPVPQKRKS